MHELKNIHIIVLILGVFIIILQLLFNSNELEDSLTTGPNILIAIISARSHFTQRKELRKSWIQTLKEYKNVQYKFFIGKKCRVHPLDRMDKLSCSELDESFPNNTDNFVNGYFSLEKNLKCTNVTANDFSSPNSIRNCYSGFGFKVLHPLKLHSIGIRWELLREQERINLVLKDAEEIFENIPVSQKSCSKVVNGFCFLDLKEKYILPKDFEGMISLSEERYYNSSKEVCQWGSDDHFTFTFGVLGGRYEKFQDNGCTNIIANFTLEDRESWESHVSLKFRRQTEWLEEEDETDNDLYIEMKSYEDIVYFNNVIDVYRNLPLKVLEMIKWSYTNYPSSFVFKIDDDVDVDIPVLMNWVSRELTGRKVLGIWSHFYHQRSLPLFGKWADFDFQGLTYPAFPCGSGYLLSDRLVYLLTMQAPFLRTFQGEDISMGIWTQVLRLGQEFVEKNHVNCWLPSQGCNHSIILPDSLAFETNRDR